MKRNPYLFSKNKTNKTNKTVFIPDAEYKNLVCENSYIGRKGYTIPKAILKDQDEKFLKEDLFVKPELFGAMFGGSQFVQESAFPVFRENTNKIYIPRFYGIERYGLPSKSELDDGDNISLEFTKPMRKPQEELIDLYLNYIKTPICNNSEKNGNGAILEVMCGFGKTVCALNIISKLKKKALIIVHKEFLMNQWIERIEEFLPGARIGKIQGPLVDIDDKDIVIGMIQSIYDKEYPADTFTSFGITIIDEVHRIGSEQFSKSLLKIVTPYMLGISATVDRKDKLTKVLYMFIGKKIYSNTERKDDVVSVRAIDYITNDSTFNEVDVDFRGNPQYSKMIVKLCEFGPRSDFIVKVIKDLLEENPTNQIMILAHNRSLLKYLYDAIEYRKIASVGYYLGGMKQSELQESETKQIVIATYAMAAEALDIKTLSTLVMVTPKTDIIQSVGRILRMKHENPIIVDIVDKHDLFQNQWKQRQRFYKKCNYIIKRIDSINYKGMNIDWENDKNWKTIYKPKEAKVESDEEECEKKNGNGIGKCLIKIDDYYIDEV